MKLYGIPNCNTVKKARAWLAKHQADVEFHDFRKDGIDEALLNSWLAQMPWEKLVNRSGMTWRNLDEESKAAVRDNASAMKLMLEKPSVIKRPVLVKDDKILALGFDEAAYQNISQNS
jgi:arsenate reductase